MNNSEPELWQRSSLDTRREYEAAVTELRRLIESRPAVGTEERDQLVSLHLLCARYESEHQATGRALLYDASSTKMRASGLPHWPSRCRSRAALSSADVAA